MINFQLSAFEQLLPNAAWAGQQRVVQGLGNPGRSRSQVTPGQASWAKQAHMLLLLRGWGHWVLGSLRHPSAGQCVPTSAEQPAAGETTPLSGREHKKNSLKKIHFWVSCTWKQNIASCQWLKGTDELSCQQWHHGLFEDVLYLWKRNNFFSRCSFPMKIYTL